MQKMLVLINRLDIERHLSEIREIAETHGIAKTYLARVSPDFGSRVRSIVAPHKLDMVARMSDAATSKYLSQIAAALREDGIDCETIGNSIPAKNLDDFIEKNNIDLVLTSDGRSGLCRWPSGGLVGRHVQFLYEHAFTDEGVKLTRGERTKSGVKKMLVLLNRLDIEERLPELRDIAMTQGVESVYLASVSSSSSSSYRTMPDAHERRPVERVVVYLVRVSRAFGSRVRSRVAPQKLDMAARMSDAVANKYLSKIADALAAEGIEAVPIGVSIPTEKVEEYIKKNNIALVVMGGGHSGLRCLPSESLSGRNIKLLYEDALAEATAILERREVKAGYGLRTMSGIALQFGALFFFWLVLSGHYSLKYILFGVASAALVTFLSNDLFSAIFHHEEREDESSSPDVLKFLRFLAYMPWLLYQIIKANIQVASIVLNPRMPIDPVILQFSTTMKREVAQVILATSITLTPGTVTISLDNGRYTIHALVPASAQDLVEANMQNKVGGIFMEKKERPPDTLWAHSIEELAQ